MSHREPIFKKRIIQINIPFQVSPVSYRRKIFVEILSLFIIIIAGVISVYRIADSHNYLISQVITSIIVTLVLISNVIIILLRTIKLNKRDEHPR